jgi:hypothetical protein
VRVSRRFTSHAHLPLYWVGLHKLDETCETDGNAKIDDGDPAAVQCDGRGRSVNKLLWTVDGTYNDRRHNLTTVYQLA